MFQAAARSSASCRCRAGRRRSNCRGEVRPGGPRRAKPELKRVALWLAWPLLLQLPRGDATAATLTGADRGACSATKRAAGAKAPGQSLPIAAAAREREPEQERLPRAAVAARALPRRIAAAEQELPEQDACPICSARAGSAGRDRPPPELLRRVQPPGPTASSGWRAASTGGCGRQPDRRARPAQRPFRALVQSPDRARASARF